MSFMASFVTDNYHEIYLQFTCKTDGSRRTFRELAGASIGRRMGNNSDSIAPEPFTVTLYQKASGALDVLLARGYINLP